MLRPGRICVALLICSIPMLLSWGHAGDNMMDPVTHPARDPLDATYMIEGALVPLIHGKIERTVVQGSATRMTTTVLGQPVYGDLNGDGSPDAAVILVHDPGGSGTFYYAAAALYIGQGYKGTNAILIGDRIVPKTIELTNYFINIAYADRLPAESMSAEPSVDRQLNLIVDNGRLAQVQLNGDKEKLLGGWVIIGHEVRSFQPCDQRQALWLMGDSPAYKKTMRAYHQALPQPEPYQKVFMLLTGELIQAPKQGFGAEYFAGFKAIRIIRVFIQGKCTRDGFRFDLLKP